MKNKSEIMDDIQSFIGRNGGNYKEWFIGSAADPKDQLFKTHGFKKGDYGLYRQAPSELQAGEIAEFFMGQGSKGASGVKAGADFVYAFKLAAHTKPGAAKK
ncbi:MAG: hypothetical protein JNK21_05930 [Rhodospirillaceae bacterium]|nr:hypothetical protein [Rhodospirillaceae bacterium]